jgi:serine/threonine protein kinase/tetratricopeptide (TPR) repeat protein
MSVDPHAAKAIFMTALDKADPAERAAYLAAACGGDELLRQRVELLLKAHSDPGSFMPSPAATIDAPVAESPGTVIGAYKLLEQIGEGGMGTVWMAQQAEPVRRLVALKLIKAGMDSNQVIARFEAERQVLAIMDHPSIAKVHDGGVTTSGRPYFVMELVKGVPITDFCDQSQFSVEERLGLLISVCQAVQHAHQKGVIHRDLKPANVVVTRQEGVPAVKVIDFGIAKAMGQQLTDKTLFTGFAQMIGTPLYMSPEQAAGGPDIDTRSDIYSLGVLMYELLTGTTPFDMERFKEAGYDEIRRIIREEEPPRPSTRISTLGQLVTTVSTHRKSDPRRLSQLVRGELDWIVMKCLEKDRNRRYETANGFAMDVQRFLADEPVLACPPSVGYRFRKFVRRNKGPVLAVSLITVALVVGATAAAVGLVRALRAEKNATEQRLIAEGEREDARKAERNERAQRQLAQKRLKQIEKREDILASIFSDLNPSAEKEGGLPLATQIGQRLETATEELSAEAAGEPVRAARLQNLLGAAQRELGSRDKAIALHSQALETLKRELGPDDPDTIATMGLLAQAYRAAGQFDKSIPLLEQALEKHKAVSGPHHLDTLDFTNGLALCYLEAGQFTRSIRLNEPTLEMMKATLGPTHRATLACLNNLAMAYRAAGQLDKALPLYQQAADGYNASLGPDNVATLTSVNNLGMAYHAAGQDEKAIPLHERTLLRQRAKLGPAHLDTLASMNNLALAYRALRQFDRAISLDEQTLEIVRLTLGPDHPRTLASMHNLALDYKESGQPHKAVPLYEQTLEKKKATLGDGHPDTLKSMVNLGAAYRDMGQTDKAISLLSAARELTTAKLAADHPDTLASEHNLALAYKAAGQLDKAILLQVETLNKAKGRLSPSHPNMLSMLYGLADSYSRAGRTPEAISFLEDARKIILQEPVPSPRKLERVRVELAAVYDQAGRFSESERLYRECVDQSVKEFGADDLRTIGGKTALGMNLLQQKRYAAAESILRSCLEVRETRQPDAWITFNTRSMLGAALAGQTKYPEAEPLLRSGYEGLKSRNANIPATQRFRVTDALERLVQLYDGLDRKEEAARWRRELEAARASKPTEQAKDK